MIFQLVGIPTNSVYVCKMNNLRDSSLKDPDSHPSVGRLLSILHRQTQVYLQKALDPLDLGHGQARVLRYIDRNPGVRQQDISEYFRLDKGSTSTLIRSLDKKGFLEKELDMEDNRAYRLVASQKAVDLRTQLEEIFSKWTDRLLNGFADSEKDQLIEQMERMIRNVVIDQKELKKWPPGITKKT